MKEILSGSYTAVEMPPGTGESEFAEAVEELAAERNRSKTTRSGMVAERFLDADVEASNQADRLLEKTAVLLGGMSIAAWYRAGETLTDLMRGNPVYTIDEADQYGVHVVSYDRQNREALVERLGVPPKGEELSVEEEFLEDLENQIYSQAP